VVERPIYEPVSPGSTPGVSQEHFINFFSLHEISLYRSTFVSFFIFYPSNLFKLLNTQHLRLVGDNTLMYIFSLHVKSE
jgi:hypothetical protein